MKRKISVFESFERLDKGMELCGMELYGRKLYDDFLQKYPEFKYCMTLVAGDYYILVFFRNDFDTRDIKEIFDDDGKLVAKFIGPDALKYTYQIELKKNN